MTVITNMPLYRAIVIRSGIGLYLKTNKKVIPNRAWTPTKMLAAAGQITGKVYKRGQHRQAYIELGSWLEVQKLKGVTLQDEVTR